MKPTTRTDLPARHILDSFWHVLLGAAFVFCLVAWVSEARAGTSHGGDQGFKPELWIDSGFWSHHTKQRTTNPYRERNEGLGIEWRFAPRWQFNAGHYDNSVGGSSMYVQAGWMPLNWSPLTEWNLKAGASIGVVNGYDRIRNGGYFPTLVPVLASEYRRVGLNLVYIPSVGRIDGAYAVQLKFRAF